MPKGTTPNAGQLFAGVGPNKKIFELQTHIQTLEAEIAALKLNQGSVDEKQALERRIASLVEQLSQQQTVQVVQFDQISRNPLQPRIIFPRADQDAFAHVLRQEGQLSPALLIPLSDRIRQQLQGYADQGLVSLNQPLVNLAAPYLLFDGERRWRSGQLSGLPGLRAVFLAEDTVGDLLELQSQAASTTLHQRSLHKLELAQFLIIQINYRFPQLRAQMGEPPEVVYPRILNTVITRLNAQKRLRELTAITTASPEEQQAWLEKFPDEAERAILHVLLNHQQNPASINRRVFPLLKLPDDLKQAVWDDGVDPDKLEALKQVNSRNLQQPEAAVRALRIQITQEALAKGWSAAEIRAAVQQAIADQSVKSVLPGSAQSTLPKVFQRLETARLENLDIDALHQARALLQQRLAEIDVLLKGKR